MLRLPHATLKVKLASLLTCQLIAAGLLLGCGGSSDANSDSPAFVASTPSEEGKEVQAGQGSESPDELDLALQYVEPLVGRGPQSSADADRQFLEARLAQEDVADAPFLRMVLNLGGFDNYQNVLETWDANSLKSLHQHYGLDYVQGEPGTALTATDDTGRVSPLNVEDCVQFFPPSDRNKTFDRFGHQVHIDGVGRPAWSSKKWSKGQQAQSAPRQSYCQSVKVPQWGAIGDVGGHLMPSVLGGFGGRANLVPQNGTLNNGSWRRLENAVRSCVGKPPAIRYTAYAYYPDSRTARPLSMKAKVFINHSSWNALDFDYREIVLFNHVPTATEVSGAEIVAAWIRRAC